MESRKWTENFFPFLSPNTETSEALQELDGEQSKERHENELLYTVHCGELAITGYGDLEIL